MSNKSILLTVTGYSLFFFPFSVLFLASLNFFLGHSLTPAIFFISFIVLYIYIYIITSILTGKINSTKKLKISFLSLCLFCLIFLLAGILANLFFDFSYDGQRYHQEAIYHLANDWNPFTQMSVGNIWVDHYPKSFWINAALVYKLTHLSELGKLYNITFLIGVFLITFPLLSEFLKINYIYTLLISLLITFNPVAVIQSITFMVDSSLATLTTAIIITLWFYVANNERLNPLKILLFLLTPLIVLYVNLKFTGLINIVFISAIFGIILILKKQIKQLFIYITVLIFALIIGVFFVGYNPYVTNLILQDNIFYPVYGKDWNSSYFLENMEPIALNGKSNLYKFIISIIALPGNYHPLSYHSKIIPLKIPFTIINSSLLNHYQVVDSRLAGFGVYFQELMILSFLSLIIIFISIIKQDLNRLKNFHFQKTIYFLVVSMGLLLTVIINPACWWARIVPQLYLFPISIIIYNLLSKNKILINVGKAMIIIGIINTVLICSVNLKHNFWLSLDVSNKLKSIKDQGYSMIISPDMDDDINMGFLMRTQGIYKIQITSVNDLNCKEPKSFFPQTNSSIKYCLDER